MIIKHETLMNKFNRSSNQYYIIDILLAYPDAVMDDFFNPSRSFYFDDWAENRVLSACKKNMKFLLHIINSPESTWLNGYEIEKLIESNTEVQQHIYQVEEFKKRHEAYQAWVDIVTTPIILTDASLSTTIKDIYQPIFEQMGALGEYELCYIIEHLAQSYDHQILAANSALVCDSYNWHRASHHYAKISEAFFSAMYAHEALREDLYVYSESLGRKYFVAFERLIQDPNALSHMSDETLYELQQKWVDVEGTKVREIFNKNPTLMQHWRKGSQLKKLREGVMISEYQEQASLQNESDALIQIRVLLSDLQQYLSFNQIAFSTENKAFITNLLQQDSLLSTVASLTTAHHEHVLSGIFWFIALTHQPNLLRESLPLGFIRQQMEITIDDLKQGKSIEASWLIKGLETPAEHPTYFLRSEAEQQQQWFHHVLTDVDINDKHLWDSLLQDHYFMNGVLGNQAYLEKLAILNWACPTVWVKQLTQPQLINIVVHLIAHYDDQNMRDQLLDNFLPEVTEFKYLFKELSSSHEDKQADVYLRLLNNQQIKLIDFLKDQKNIILLRKFDALQQYFIVNHTHEIKTDLFELIDSYCKRNLLGDALTIFSLMYEFKLEDDVNHVLPNYSEVQEDRQTWLLRGFAGMAAAMAVGLRHSLSDNVFLGSMIGSIALVAYSLYGIDEREKSVQISYQEALSRKNISHFFKPDTSSAPSMHTEEMMENSIMM